MSRLATEIADFLESSGLNHSLQMRHGMEVICLKTRGSGSDRMILPVEISSRTQEDAAAMAGSISECLRLIQIMDVMARTGMAGSILPVTTRNRLYLPTLT